MLVPCIIGSMAHSNRSKINKSACLIVISALIAIYGWNGAKNNPLFGWSSVKIRLGLAPMPGSGDRAYFVGGYGPMAQLELDHSVPAENVVMVLVRRDRRGLFIPWIETYDLRMVSATGQKLPWQTGTDDPRWEPTLKLARDWYATHDEEWYQTIVAGIDTELAGGYPDRRIRPWYLMLEIIVLFAHVALIGAALYRFHRLMKPHHTPKHLAHVPSSMVSAGFESS